MCVFAFVSACFNVCVSVECMYIVVSMCCFVHVCVFFECVLAAQCV